MSEKLLTPRPVRFTEAEVAELNGLQHVVNLTAGMVAHAREQQRQRTLQLLAAHGVSGEELGLSWNVDLGTGVVTATLPMVDAASAEEVKS